MWLVGPIASRHVESSWTGDRTYVPCIGRQVPIHFSAREVLPPRPESFWLLLSLLCPGPSAALSCLMSLLLDCQSFFWPLLAPRVGGRAQSGGLSGTRTRCCPSPPPPLAPITLKRESTVGLEALLLTYLHFLSPPHIRQWTTKCCSPSSENSQPLPASTRGSLCLHYLPAALEKFLNTVSPESSPPHPTSPPDIASPSATRALGSACPHGTWSPWQAGPGLSHLGIHGGRHSRKEALRKSQPKEWIY